MTGRSRPQPFSREEAPWAGRASRRRAVEGHPGARANPAGDTPLSCRATRTAALRVGTREVMRSPNREPVACAFRSRKQGGTARANSRPEGREFFVSDARPRTEGWVHESERDPPEIPRLLRLQGAQDRAERPARADRRPVALVDQRRDGPLEEVLRRPPGARQPAHRQRPEVHPHQRHRERREDGPPPHALRDARKLLHRRLLQGRGHHLGVGVPHQQGVDRL